MYGRRYRSFYDERRRETYGEDYERMRAEDHPHYAVLRAFIEEFELRDKKCLEIGSSGGFFQDMVEDYWGTDIAHSLARHYHKPYRVTVGPRFPFDDGMFDAIWTINVYEHIPGLNEAMLEIERLLKPGGVVLFAPAWQCRPWAADGYGIRPYRELDWRGRVTRATIPLRDSVLWRLAWLLPKRVWRHVGFLLGRRFPQIRFRRLNPNYEVFWQSDSDACNSIDPHDAILWFLSHGFACVSRPTNLAVFTVRTGALVFRKAS